RPPDPLDDLLEELALVGRVRVPDLLLLRPEAVEDDGRGEAVAAEPGLAVHLSHAARLAPAEGRLQRAVRHRAVVDADRAGLDAPRDGHGLRVVARPNVGGEAVR